MEAAERCDEVSGQGELHDSGVCSEQLYATDSESLPDEEQSSVLSGSDAFMLSGPPCTPVTVAFWGPSRTSQGASDAEFDYWVHLHSLEISNTVDSDYMSHQCSTQQPQLLNPSARASAVDWMVDASWQLGLSNDALFLAVALLDRFLAQKWQQQSAERLTLLSAVCLWVAAKYEHSRAPPLELFSRFLLRGSFSTDAFLAMEAELLVAIDYRLASVTTTKTFLRRLMFEICSLGNPNAAPPLDDKLYFLTSYLAEASLLEYGLLAFLPSRVAAASFALAHVLLARPLSEEALTRLTGYCPADLSAPVGWLRQVHSVLAQAGGRYAVTVKYQSAATARAALVAPIVSLNDPRLAGACSDSGATAPLSRAGTAAPADAYAGRGWWQQQQL